MKAHLLFADEDFDFRRAPFTGYEDLSQDLELKGVFNVMAQGDKYLLDVATRVVLASMRSPATIVYRQNVLKDCLSNPAMLREIYSIAVSSKEDRRGLFWGRSSQFPASILSGSVSELQMYVALLKRLRQLADEYVEKVSSEGLLALFRSLQKDLSDDYFEEIDLHLRQLRFKDGVLLSSELGKDNSGVNIVLRDARESRSRWKERVHMAPRSSYGFSIASRDEAGAKILGDLTSRGINLVANAVAQSADHIDSYFTMLRAEVGFYVGCLNLWEALEAKGAPYCFPVVSASDSVVLRGSNLRDTSLTLRVETPIVGNDVDADGATLLIITGANSGGKSTFLRSVGQAQIFSQCGMFVTASAYYANVANGVFTHFIREEDSSMKSGRLVEELSRMSQLAGQVTPGSLVLFNESFAATNEREGSEIARQVVNALLDVNVKVIFVTHQYDFAHSYYEQREVRPIRFLRAPREMDGRRTFKLEVGEPLATSFGEDIYEKVFLAPATVTDAPA